MRFRVPAALALAALSLGMTTQDSGGPRTPITAPTGPHGFPTGPMSGFASVEPGMGGIAILFSLRGGVFRLMTPFGPIEPFGSTENAEIRLELPPLVASFDEGAVAAGAEIAVSRNPTLVSALLQVSATGSPDDASSRVAGELYLRIRKPAAVGGLRADVPTNAFAARAMRPVPDRVFRGRKE